MATLNSLLTAMSKSQPNGWGSSSHTWGGVSTKSSIPKFGKKHSESQSVANSIMKRSKAKGSKSHESLLGSILGGAADVSGNLVDDVIDTAENVPSGLLKIATTNPVDTAKAIGADYKARYGKLFSGDFGGFASDLGKHPLAYILDAATVGTMGAGGLARAGLLSNELTTTGLRLSRTPVTGLKPGSIEKLFGSKAKAIDTKPATKLQPLQKEMKQGYEQGSLFDSAPGENLLDGIGADASSKTYLPESMRRPAKEVEHTPTVQINLSRNPFTRQLQKGVYGVQAKLPENIPVIGEIAAAKRATATQYMQDIAGKSLAEKQIIRDAYKGDFGDAATASLSKYAHHVDPGGVLGKSTQHWKDVVLAMRPAFITNNIFGNTGMVGGAMSLNPVAFGRATALTVKGDLDVPFERFFKGSDATLGSTEQVAGTGRYRRTVNRSYNLQGGHEKMGRKALMYNAAMKVPEIKALVRKYVGEGVPETIGRPLLNKHGKAWANEITPSGPMSEGAALTKAMDEVFAGPNGRAIHREISSKIEDALGDYTRYSAGEQRLKKIIPFYGWNRHSSRFMYATARDRPGQMLALNQISKIGEQAHNDWGWQGTPDFMKGYLNIGGHTFDTAPLNPLKGATDTLKSVRQVVNGDPSIGEASSNLNPFIASGIQALTGKSLLTGAPIDKGKHGILGSVAQQTITGLPQWKLLMKGIPDGGPDTSNPHTYLTPTGLLKAKFKDAEGHVKLDAQGNPVETANRHMLNSSFQSMLATFIGAPDRGTVNKKVAREVAKKIETEKHPNDFRPRKKRKKKTSFKAVVDTQRKSGWGAGQSNWGG